VKELSTVLGFQDLLEFLNVKDLVVSGTGNHTKLGVNQDPVLKVVRLVIYGATFF
jgi:hypothetical protein